MNKLQTKAGPGPEGSFVLFYMGASMLDASIVYTSSMMPWIISEILRFSNNDMVVLRVKDFILSVYTCDVSSTPIFDCHVWEVVKCFQVALDDPTDARHYFGVVVRTSSTYYHCRLFASTSEAQVAGIMSTMTESSKKCPSGPGSVVRSNSSPKMAECVSDTISFEVLYTGKLRMSYRKAPVTFIDDALEKFKSYESERGSRESNATTNSNESRRSSSQESTESTSDGLHHVAALLKNIDRDTDETDRKIQSNPTLTFDRAEKEDRVVPKAPFPHPLEDIKLTNGQQRPRNPSGDTYLVKSLSLPVEPVRSRALSTGHDPRVLEAPKSSTPSNRTMILIIGKQEMRIISPDAKVTLFNKGYREISQIATGIKNKECFGFICREAGASGTTYVGYIFRCQSESVSTEILHVLRQASASQANPAKKELQLVCDHCPMMWYHRLCSEIDGLGEEKVNAVILRRMDGLADEDRANIMAKFSGAQTQSMEEQNELMMMLLRAHCESKQLNHTHDTEENRHEFLQSYLGGGTILMKAKRSISSSFDQLIKRKEQRLKDTREINTILPHHVIHQGKEMSPSAESTKTPTKLIGDMRVSDSPLENTSFRPRSSTLGSDSADKIRTELKGRRGSQIPSSHTAQASTGPSVLKDSTPDPSNIYAYSPMMNIFLKVGSQKPTNNNNAANTNSTGPRRQGSWRQAIFKRAVSPAASEKEPIPSLQPNQKLMSSRLGPGYVNGGKISAQQYRPPRSQAEFRELWKSAIKQQILLLRMEKQNRILRDKQEETNVKRNKLSYKELGFCVGNAATAWNSLIGMAQSNPNKQVGRWLLKNCLINGVPKQMRGHIWKFIIQQNKLKPDFEPKSDFVPNNTPYDQLLRLLTSHQHAILIDLGRTFPNHPYFSSPLGSGQLALFNLLKAYSLLDPEVGYCQGLSFVAGILLMHLDEEDAFEVLKYLMFNLNGRKHYKPDMSGLQLKLYQMNRLMYDLDTELHFLLYHNDVLPSLYAAPWLLTMFASQFSIGFAARVMDMVLLSGVDVLIKLALVVIQDFKPQLMDCGGLEQIMECFKTTVTQISSAQMDAYLNTILGMDEGLLAPGKTLPSRSWNPSLHTYAIEYDVLTDETFMEYLNNPNPTRTKSCKNYKSKAEEEEEMDTARLRVEKEGLEKNVKALVSYVHQLEFMLKCRNEKIPPKPECLTNLLVLEAPGGGGSHNGVGSDVLLKKKLILPSPSDYAPLGSLRSSASPPSGYHANPSIPTIDEDGFRVPPTRTRPQNNHHY